MKLIMSLICLLSLSEVATALTLRSAYKAETDRLCMDISRADASSWRYNTNVEIWWCHGQDNQQFTLQPYSTSDGLTTYTIQALGKCLDIDMGYQEEWTHNNNVQLYTCNYGLNQQFQIVPERDGWFTLRSQLDGRCLDIDLNNAAGWRYQRNVHLWTCSAESNQLWRFEDNGVIVIPVD